MPEKRAVTVVSPSEPVPDEFDLLCERCSYSLVGLQQNRCPECGLPFDPSQLPLARVPWLYRRRIGRLRSYWQTCRSILVGPVSFARELCRPVRLSRSDARQFRRVTALVASISGLAAATALVVLLFPWDQIGLAQLPFLEAAGVIAMISLMLLAGAGVMWTYVMVATDLPTFIWEGIDGRGNELAPLHHYASAPVALSPLVALVLICGAMIDRFAGAAGFAIWFATVAGGAVFALILVLLLVIPLMFMRTTTGCSIARLLLLVVYLPVHWLMMTFLFLFLIGLIAGGGIAIIDRLLGY